MMSEAIGHRIKQAPRRTRQATSSQSWPFLAPLIAALTFSTLFPLIYAAYLSLFNWNWGSSFSFVGVANYTDIARNTEYWESIFRTLAFAVMAVSLEIIVGLGLALAVTEAGRHAGWLRSVLIIPLMISGITVALVWKVMLDPTIGVISRLLSNVGLSNVNLLGSTSTALITMALLDTWWQTGFAFLILNAGLLALPLEPFEAAMLDGAGYWQRVRFLTLPMMGPLIAVVAGIRSIDCLKLFALVFGTTGGGPGQATESTQMLAYRTAFKANQMSMSMAMMVCYTVLIGVVVVAVRLMHKRRRHA